MTDVKFECYIAILETIYCVQKRAQVRLKMLFTKCVYKAYIYIYIERERESERERGFGIK